MNKKKSIAVAAVLAVILLIGGLLAYFTDTDQATNKFTIGADVDIVLTETLFPTEDSNVNGVPDVCENLVPGQTIDKNPVVSLNTGSNDAFVFLTVTVPALTTETSAGSGEYTASKELYTYSVDSAWEEVSNLKKVTSNSVTHVYVYGTTSAPVFLSSTVSNHTTSTSALFSSVTVNTTLTNAEAANFRGATPNSNIVVNAYGIQTNGYTATTAADIFGLLNVTL